MGETRQVIRRYRYASMLVGTGIRVVLPTYTLSIAIHTPHVPACIPFSLSECAKCLTLLLTCVTRTQQQAS